MEAISQIKLDESGKRNAEMPFTKIEGFLKEFPWVTKYIPQQDIRQVYVSRITPEIVSDRLAMGKINYQVRVNGWEVSYMETRTKDVSETIFLLDAEGAVVCHDEENEVVTPAHSYRKYWLFGPRINVPEKKEMVKNKYVACELAPRRIKDMLDALKGDADRVRFVISYYVRTGGVIIYKSPQGVTSPDWIKQQIEVERSAIKKECEAIDAEVALK